MTETPWQLPRIDYIPRLKIVPDDSFHRMQKCSECSYGSKSLNFMKNHLEKHNTVKSSFSCNSNTPELFYCTECDYKTFLFVNFNKHLKEIHRSGGHPVNYNYANKILTHFSCKNCTFATYSALRWHMHTEAFECSTEGHEMKFECDKCFFQTDQRSKFKKHDCFKSQMLHSSDSVMQEEVSDNTSLNQTVTEKQKKLNAKVKYNHKSELRNYQSFNIKIHCMHCDYITEEKNDISHYFKHVAPEQKKLFQCNLCDYKTTKKYNMSRHKMNKHTASNKIKWFQCDRCHYKTKDKRHLSYHTLCKHTASKKIQWLHCDYCDYKAKRKLNISRHFMSKHAAPNKLTWFQCDHCDYKTNRKNNVSRHIMLRHTPPNKIRWFQCDRCGFKSKQKHHLSSHIFKKHTPSRKTKWFADGEIKS